MPWSGGNGWPTRFPSAPAGSRPESPRLRTPDDDLGVVADLVLTRDPYGMEDLPLYLSAKETDPAPREHTYESTHTIEDDSGAISTMVDGDSSSSSSRR